MTIQGKNLENPIDGQSESPKWTNNNVLRVCMQYWEEDTSPFDREMVRFVLNYTYPRYFPVY